VSTGSPNIDGKAHEIQTRTHRSQDEKPGCLGAVLLRRARDAQTPRPHIERQVDGLPHIRRERSRRRSPRGRRASVPRGRNPRRPRAYRFFASGTGARSCSPSGNTWRHSASFDGARSSTTSARRCTSRIRTGSNSRSLPLDSLRSPRSGVRRGSEISIRPIANRPNNPRMGAGTSFRFRSRIGAPMHRSRHKAGYRALRLGGLGFFLAAFFGSFS
jgi:hypothetical protein